MSNNGPVRVGPSEQMLRNDRQQIDYPPSHKTCAKPDDSADRHEHEHAEYSSELIAQPAPNDQPHGVLSKVVIVLYSLVIRQT